MALADITLNDGQGTPVAHTFTYVGQQNGRVIRVDMSAAAETPWNLTMGHMAKKVANKNVRSHLIRFDITVLDSDGITPYTANIRVMADIPDPIRSDALADDLAALVRNWATSANVRAWAKDSVG